MTGSSAAWTPGGGDRRRPRSPSAASTVAVVTGLALACAAFVLLDQGHNRLVGPLFPSTDTAWSATVYGVVTRLHLILPLAVLALWRPRLVGFRSGRTRRHLRALLIVLLANCGIVGGYLVLAGGSTPYSGDQWLVTEVVTVPIVEEVMWRGVVLGALLWAFERAAQQRAAAPLAVWCSGLAFGLLHGANVLAGLPAAFVVLQVVNATVWGVVYGYARVRTGSIYPPIVLHAAMNATVVLL